MLNSLYGKFGTSLEIKSKAPYLDDKGIVHYRLLPEEIKEGLYIPTASFITSYARKITIETSQAIKEYSLNKYGKDMYIYSDTDSIHTSLPLEELKKFCEIDDFELGKWANEANPTKGKFIRQKCYIEEIDGELNITCAGMPKKCVYYHKDEDGKKIDNQLYYKDLDGEEKIFTMKEFETGFSCGGKLTFNHVKGGVILVETDFTLKDEKVLKTLQKM